MTTKPITTSLMAIRKHTPCEDGWENLLKFLNKTKADDEPLKFSTILESNGPDDALWCLRALPQKDRPKIGHLVADYAERVLHIYEEKYPEDKRPRKAIDAARKFADGKISQEKLAAARAAADKAAGDAFDAFDAYAADAAWAASARAAWAAADSASAAAGDARDAERKAQAELLVKFFG